MDSIRDLAPEIQQRISAFQHDLRQSGLSLPAVKNVTSLLWAVLKERSVLLMALARALEEPIAPKKTWERLRRWVGKKGLWKKLLGIHRKKNARDIRGKKYCIVDLSDIRKLYSEQMEGLGRVRDGDKKEIGNGYYWLNLTMADSTGMTPVYTELYSLDHAESAQESENKKLLAGIEWVWKVHRWAIFIIDRGGDRGALLVRFFRDSIRFIVRGQDTRNVWLDKECAKKINIRQAACGTKTDWRYESRTGTAFRVGCRRIYLEGKALWLVATRREENLNALSWFLTNVEGTWKKVMDTVMEGYGYRWRVEEYHRQVKQDYGLEWMCVRGYEALQNMTALVMLAAAFVMRLPRMLAFRLARAAKRLPRNRESDILSYGYYMFSAAVSWLLHACRKRQSNPLHLLS